MLSMQQGCIGRETCLLRVPRGPSLQPPCRGLYTAHYRSEPTLGATPIRSLCNDTRRARGEALVCLAAVGEERASTESPASTTLSQLPSLKEWAPTCAALASGDQTVLLRKGGIKEPTFTPAASEFLLFPTAFHTDAQLLKPDGAIKFAKEVQFDPKAEPELEFSVFARVTGAWTTFDPRVLQLLDGLHIWSPEFLESRLRWRERQPITVLELRAYKLQQPLRVPAEERFWGCFSWVDVPLPQQLAEAPQQLLAMATPALSDAEFAARQEECRRQLSQIEVHELELPS